ncbi:MAG TPA: GNAT family N-acetyltransferase [Sphingomicrobium sp.]|nr:GNAT family N-acetyltransferase [Sphingomicrobium sp.]
MIREAPRIETERLILREFRAGDLDAHAAMLGDPEIMRHIGGKPLNREDSWRRLLMGIGMWSLVGMGPWAVERKSDRCMVGHCGFFQFHREMTPLIPGEPEMGWIFDRWVHGQGIAFEACQAALAWAECEIGADSYPAIIDLDNAASMKLADRLGFVRQDDAQYRGSTIAFYRRPRRS